MKWSAHDHHESASCSLRVRGARSSSSSIAAIISRASARPRLSVISISVRFTGAALHKAPLRRAHGCGETVGAAAYGADMSVVRFATFDTAVGCCAVAWGEGGIVGTWLPGSTPASTLRAVMRRHPDAEEATPPPPVAEAIEGMAGLLSGDDVDLRGVALDMSGVPEFQQDVYAVARSLPRGVTMTYGEIAAKVGAPGAAQAVGQAMGHNPFPIVVPCHRVVAAGGANGGFSAPGGVDTKLRLLAIEGATLF